MMCVQQRLRSHSSFAQSDQSLLSAWRLEDYWYGAVPSKKWWDTDWYEMLLDTHHLCYVLLWLSSLVNVILTSYGAAHRTGSLFLVYVLPVGLQLPLLLAPSLEMVRTDLSCLMTKPTKRLCAQWRLRSAWAYTQSDQYLPCALNR